MNAHRSAQVAIRAFHDAKRARASTVRSNAGYRMAGRPHMVQPLPKLPAKPVKYLLEGQNGEYIGTEWDSEFAHDYAAEHDCKITILPFDT